MADTLAVALRDAERHKRNEPAYYTWYLHEPRGKPWRLFQMPNSKTLTQVFADTSIPGQVHRIYADKPDMRELHGDELAEWANKNHERGMAAANERLAAIDRADKADSKSVKRPRGRAPRMARH